MFTTLDLDTVYFLKQGGLGNHLFQFFAAEMIAFVFKKQHIRAITTDTAISDRAVHRITDKEFILIFSSSRSLSHAASMLDCSGVSRKCILLDGFFQRTDCLWLARRYLKDNWKYTQTSHLLSEEIKNLVSTADEVPLNPGFEELVMHIRLGDFCHQGHNSEIFHPTSLQSIINQQKFDILTIICAAPKQGWECDYLKTMIQATKTCHSTANVRFLIGSNEQGLVFGDLSALMTTSIQSTVALHFNYLRMAKKLLLSPSTFAHAAALLSDADEILVPYNIRHGGPATTGQHLAALDESYKIYFGMDYLNLFTGQRLPCWLSPLPPLPPLPLH